MDEKTLSSFVLILIVAALAPVVADGLARWVRVPSVVLEIVAGVLIGPALGWAQVDDVIEFLSQLGLALLMFLAGLEIDLPRVRGRPLQRALAGWVISLDAGVGSASPRSGIDGARSGLISGLAITTTALARCCRSCATAASSAPRSARACWPAPASASSARSWPSRSCSAATARPAPPWCCPVRRRGRRRAAVALRERNARLARLIEATLTTSGQLAVRLVVLFIATMVWTPTSSASTSSSAPSPPGWSPGCSPPGPANARRSWSRPSCRDSGSGSSCPSSSSSAACGSTSTP